jgi:hypothetical protein
MCCCCCFFSSLKYFDLFFVYVYVSGLSSSFRSLIFFCACAFLFLFIQVLQNTKAKCLCANLVTGCFLLLACVFVCSLLKASSLCQMFEHLYVFCLCVSDIVSMLAFISYNRLAFMWHIYLCLLLLLSN